MQPDWESVLWMLGVGLALTLIFALAAYLLLRWITARITHRIAVLAERHLATTLTPGAARAQSRLRTPRSSLSDAQRRKTLAQLDQLAWLMDRVIPLPLIGGVGLDALLGLFPVVGDVLSLAISSMLIVRAAQLGAPPEVISRLIAIQCIDLVIGFVPVIGDLADAGYHANERSVAILREWMERRER